MSSRNVPFCFEQKILENDLVSLVPYDPAEHTPKFVQTITTDPSTLAYVLFPDDIYTEDKFNKNLYEKLITNSSGDAMYAVYDKSPASLTRTPQENYAGIVALVGTDKDNSLTEIGIVIFPSFHGTHVATHSVGLLLLWTMDPPSTGGLGLRRVQWQCHAENMASRRAALAFGFELEGVLRWYKAVAPHCVAGVDVSALEVRNGVAEGSLAKGRHSAMHSIVWEEWEEKREKLIARMERKRRLCLDGSKAL